MCLVEARRGCWSDTTTDALARGDDATTVQEHPSRASPHPGLRGLELVG